MKRHWFLKSVSSIALALVLLSCQSAYEKLEKSELSSGKKVKELFFGLELGMLFYPKFEEDKIYLMQVESTCKAWVPWNEDLSGKTLREDAVKLFEEWYGPEFNEVSKEDRS